MSTVDRRLADRIDRLEASGTARAFAILAALAAFAVLIATAYQISLDLAQRQEDREIRRDEAITRAWERLLMRASGNTGKGAALSLINREVESVRFLNLSCEKIGEWDDDTETCSERPMFDTVEFPTGASELNMNDTQIWWVSASNVVISGSFDRSEIGGAQLKAVNFYANLDNAEILSSDIVSSTLNASVGTIPSLFRVSLSDSTVSWLGLIPLGQLDTLYFWADAPPRLPDRPAVATVTKEDQIRQIYMMNACEPPSGVGLSSRPAIMVEQIRIRAVTPQCKTISIDEARRRYPDAYKHLPPPGG